MYIEILNAENGIKRKLFTKYMVINNADDKRLIEGTLNASSIKGYQTVAIKLAKIYAIKAHRKIEQSNDNHMVKQIGRVKFKEKAEL